MMVRGVCCLRPGIPGVSDRIEVRSLVGRFLEHSRLYLFENGGQPEVYLGSADLMERNLDRRVEVLCPVVDPDWNAHVRTVVFETLWHDTARAWHLHADGSYTRMPPPASGPAVDAQAALLDHYTGHTPLARATTAGTASRPGR